MSRPRLVKNPDLRALLVAMPSSALNRWYDDGGPTSGDGPPSAAYSRVTAPSAFDVLAPFARSLANLVEQTYAVERLSTPHRESSEIDPAAESIGFAPGGESAGLTFAVRDGAVDLLAGTWWDGCYPDCGCDACNRAVFDPDAITESGEQ